MLLGLVFSCSSLKESKNILVSLTLELEWFGLAHMSINSVTHVTIDMSITDYKLYITTQLIIYGHPPNIMY
jgi:hypothetical protein